MRRLFDDQGKRRTPLQKAHDIIVVCMTPTRKTRIMGKANIQFGVFKVVMGNLMEKGFVKKEDVNYAATLSGIDFADTIAKIHEEFE